jgi:tRNA(fMet)-specific endonuclease VapC
LILLDTNILVAYLNGHAGIARRMLDHLPEIAIPALVAAELYYGACASIRAEENLTRLDRLWQVMPVIGFDLRAARRFGLLKADLRKRGKPTGETDAWIASIALEHGATLVTHNTKDFQHVPALILEDWIGASQE